MWTPQNRKRYDRSRLRYPSDLTDEEWAHVAPVIPPAKPGGNKRTVDVREVMNGVMYVLSTGCQWRALPKDLPPKSTVHDYFILWTCDGTLDRIHHALYVACREQAEREASPTAAIIDSQSEKSASLSARWRGSTAAADSPRIGRTSIAQRSRFCASPQSGSCSENFVILTDVFGQTLRSISLILSCTTSTWVTKPTTRSNNQHWPS
jgi:transposase